MAHIHAELEHQLLTLSRRNPRLRGNGSGPDGLERSSYAILCLLLDEGPQRIGGIARAFDLDPSTVTRQVQTVTRMGLVARSQDDSDGRATILQLTDCGVAAVEDARTARSDVLSDLLTQWPESDQRTFLRLLSRFNDDVAGWSRR